MSAPVQVTQDQIAYKKKVGRLGDAHIYEVGLIGGLHLIMKAGQKAPLGAGPHRAVARHIALKRNPELEFTELSKSDHIEPHLYETLVPKYEGLTDEMARVVQE
jgi:hypothetical protein